MLKKLTGLIILGFLLVNIYGCFALFAGAAGGAGTAAWLSGKLTQQFDAPYERTINAAKKSLAALKLNLDKETKDKEVTQLRSESLDGKEIWVDIRPVSEKATKVEVRVGVVSPDKETAEKILKKIERYI